MLRTRTFAGDNWHLATPCTVRANNLCSVSKPRISRKLGKNLLKNPLYK